MFKPSGLDPARLVFIDESATKTNITRLRDRSPKSERLVCHAPHGHWCTTTMISSGRLDGTTACMTTEGATNTEVFCAYVREVLAPTLRRGDIVVMDNLGSHKNERTLALIEAVGAEVRFRPAYSPIELMWSKVKASFAMPKPVTTPICLPPSPPPSPPSYPMTPSAGLPTAGYSFI